MSFLSRFVPLAATLVISCASVPAVAADPAVPAEPAIAADVDGRIAAGRALLDAGKPKEAEAVFEAAAASDAQSLRTRQWVIRSWLPQGRVNDSLDAIDALAKEGAKGPALDYLYGMAFAFKGREYAQQKVQGQIVDMAFSDAVDYLTKATAAEPVLYKDAFVPLAEAAWFQQKLDVARDAAEKAVAADAGSADAAMMLGRIALSQYVATKEDAARAADADRHWETARRSFDAAATSLRAVPERRAEAAAALVELGHVHAWKGQLDEASRAYGAAIALAPDRVNFSQVLGTLQGTDKFLAMLEAATAEFAKLHAPDSKDDAALLWWLGWARYEQKQYAEAEDALSRAYAKNDGYLNSWYYIALARYQQKDYEGAFDALRRNWDESSEDLVASLASNKDVNLAILDYLVGWAAQGDRTFAAALLSEMQANTAPTVARYWNNMGLFYRDAGEPLRASGNEDDRKTATSYFETAYRAYSAAHELTPDDPSIQNDLAVMLHYYLDRDLERAAELYKRATERATLELARADLPADLRSLYEIALRDSKNNLAKLERGDKRN